MRVPHRAVSEETSPPPATAQSKWGPYGNGGNFGANMAVVLATLFGAFVLALATNALIRYLCGRQRQQSTSAVGQPEKPSATNDTAQALEGLPMLIFSVGMKLPASADCAICLAEFADGDAVRLLPNCHHCFHIGCVDRWIACRRSCPTCRKSCLPTAPPAPAPAAEEFV